MYQYMSNSLVLEETGGAESMTGSVAVFLNKFGENRYFKLSVALENFNFFRLKVRVRIQRKK